MTKKHHAPLVVGNWKLNPTTLGQAKKLFLDIRNSIARKKMHCVVTVAAPFPYIGALEALSPSKRVELSAQDVFYEEKGTFTGEVSSTILKSSGVTSVIIGHSERRALGETDELVQKKVSAAIKAGLTVIVCVGEEARDGQGHYFSYVETQVETILKAVPKNKLKQLVIAYEPIWAISKGDGKGKTATHEDAHEMKIFIQKIVADKFTRKSVEKVRIIYGGSVNAKNAEEMLVEGGVDGFLVGGASLRAGEFLKIINIANQHGK